MKACDSCEFRKFCAMSNIVNGCSRYKKDETTNEQWIKQASTEQLAEWFLDHMDCIGCPASQEKCHRYYDACKEVMVEWLKQPHREE